MLRSSVVALLMAALATPVAAQSSSAVRWGAIHLYQAEILDDALPDTNELVAYVRRIEAAANPAFEAHPTNASGLIFVAVKPGGRARVWVLGDNGAMTSTVKAQIETTLSAVAPARVPRHFLFALSFSAGSAPNYVAPNPPPSPPEWQAQVPPQGVMLDDAFISRVWP